MSQYPYGGSPVQPKPQPNVYTVLLIIAILVLGVAVGLCANYLMSPVENGAGYGKTVSDLFEPMKDAAQSPGR